MKTRGGAAVAVLQQTLFILSLRGRDLPLYTCSTPNEPLLHSADTG